MKNFRNSLYMQLIMMTIIPLICLTVVATSFSLRTMTDNVNDEIHDNLRTTAGSVANAYDSMYPGDYSCMEQEDNKDQPYILMKGDSIINNDNTFLDSIKNDYKVDITLFYDSYRVMTTISSPQGDRILGSSAPNNVIRNTLNLGEETFSMDMEVYDKSYYAVYIPLKNADGSIAGMCFAGKPRKEITQKILRDTLSLILRAVFVMILGVLLCIFTTKRIAGNISKIMIFLTQLSTGDLNATLPAKVRNRKDEIGELGRLGIHLQNSLRDLVEKDPLLNALYNRRSGTQLLNKSLDYAKEQKRPLTIAIGDIDFFKRINDTYGHNFGDIILKNVASIFHRNIKEIGYAIRWGGEEFVLVFENMSLDDAKVQVEILLNEIRLAKADCDGETVKITMTFGMSSYDFESSAGDLVRIADENLYHGKQNGRNQIVLPS